jgi:hypothetical protein
MNCTGKGSSGCISSCTDGVVPCGAAAAAAAAAESPPHTPHPTPHTLAHTHTHLHPTKVHQEDAAPSPAALHHNVVGLDVSAGRVQAGAAPLAGSTAAHSIAPRSTRRTPRAEGAALPGVQQGARLPPHLWMTGGRRLPRYCRMASSSVAIRVTSASSALQPEPTISASDLPLASSCTAG